MILELKEEQEKNVLQKEASQKQRYREGGVYIRVADTRSRKGRWLELNAGVAWRIRATCDQ